MALLGPRQPIARRRLQSEYKLVVVPRVCTALMTPLGAQIYGRGQSSRRKAKGGDAISGWCSIIFCLARAMRIIRHAHAKYRRKGCMCWRNARALAGSAIGPHVGGQPV